MPKGTNNSTDPSNHGQTKNPPRVLAIPIVFFLLVMGLFLVLAKGSALAPFIYSLF